MKFQITRPSAARHVSFKFASTAPRGLAMGAHATDDEYCIAATGTNFIGFVTRPVTADGDVLENHVYPGRIESDFKSGYEVTLEKADEVEAAGADHLVTSGTGAIADDTSVGTEVSFYAGKFRQKQAGEIGYFTISAHLGNDDDGDFIVRLEKVGP